MPERTTACQLPSPRVGDSSPISTDNTRTELTSIEQVFEYSAERGGGLPVLAARQWAATTPSRATTDGYSWLQAVHWIHGAGIHQPTRGPRFGDTTIRIARILAKLNPCRPSVGYLMRVTKLSERTVQYHLGLLRQMGLLAYASMGGRRKGATAEASEFVRVIPPVFDTALGIRTTGQGIARRVTGIAEHGRKAIAKLAKAAAAKPRRKPKTPSKTTPKPGRRCTPIEGGTCKPSSDRGTPSPSESKLASGTNTSPTPKKTSSSSSKRALNRVGRRYQLAGELIAQVPWLAGASRARIAWIVGPVADAGWTAAEVQAWLTNGTPPGRITRPSGFLAARLKDATRIWPTAEDRARAVEAARDSRRAEQDRHIDWHAEWTLPTSPAVRRQLAQAFADMVPAPVDETGGFLVSADTAPMRIEDFTREEVIDLRTDAAKDPDVVRSFIDLLGERDARRLLTNRLVDLALNPVTARALAATF